MKTLNQLEEIQKQLLQMQNELKATAKRQIASLEESKEKQALQVFSRRLETAKDSEALENIENDVLKFINGYK